MQTMSMKALKTERIYQYSSPINVSKDAMPHCNNCGDPCYRTYFCVGKFIFCQSCLNEAEGE
jgi:hypothetical protein